MTVNKLLCLKVCTYKIRILDEARQCRTQHLLSCLYLDDRTEMLSMMQISSKPNSTKIELKAAAPAGQVNGDTQIRSLSARRSGNSPMSPSRVDVPGNLGKLALNGILKPHTGKPSATLRTKSSSSRSAQALTAPSASLVSTSLVRADPGQHLYFVYWKNISLFRGVQTIQSCKAPQILQWKSTHIDVVSWPFKSCCLRCCLCVCTVMSVHPNRKQTTNRFQPRIRFP